MTTKPHFQGWEVRYTNGYPVVESTDDRVCITFCNNLSKLENAEVASLVAAAPKLLAALQDVIGWVPGRSAWHTDAPTESVKRARTAIAEALGEAS